MSSVIWLTSRLSWRALGLYWVREQAALVAGGTSALFSIIVVVVMLWPPDSPAASSSAGSDFGTNNLDLIPETKSLWSESMLWDKDIVLRTGLGYKDNVLLSPAAPQGSGFFLNGLDLTIFRLPLDGLEFNFSVTGDDLRYWKNPDGVYAEDLWLVSVQAQKYFAGEWRAGAEARFTYADQVLQELISTGGVSAVEAKGETVGLTPFIRRDLGTNWWVRLEAPLMYEWWGAPLDNYGKYGGQASVGYSCGHHSQISLSYGGFYLPHSDWLARDSQGNEIPGRKLAIWRQVVDLKWEQQWDARQHWATTTRLGFDYDQDNGGGYFNYYRYSLSEELRFHTAKWEFKGTAGVSYYDFPIQTVAIPPSPTLYLTSITFLFRIEREIYKSARLFGSYEYDRALSNDPASQYTAQTVLGGLSWEF